MHEEKETGSLQEQGRPGEATGDASLNDLQPDDLRLYVADPENWEAHVKQGWEKEYCYAKRPADDYFHLLVSGEVYLKKGNEKYCLSCAKRHGVLTKDRLHWQHRKSQQG